MFVNKKLVDETLFFNSVNHGIYDFKMAKEEIERMSSNEITEALMEYLIYDLITKQKKYVANFVILSPIFLKEPINEKKRMSFFSTNTITKKYILVPFNDKDSNSWAMALFHNIYMNYSLNAYCQHVTHYIKENGINNNQMMLLVSEKMKDEKERIGKEIVKLLEAFINCNQSLNEAIDYSILPMYFNKEDDSGKGVLAYIQEMVKRGNADQYIFDFKPKSQMDKGFDKIYQEDPALATKYENRLKTNEEMDSYKKDNKGLLPDTFDPFQVKMKFTPLSMSQNNNNLFVKKGIKGKAPIQMHINNQDKLQDNPPRMSKIPSKEDLTTSCVSYGPLNNSLSSSPVGKKRSSVPTQLNTGNTRNALSLIPGNTTNRMNQSLNFQANYSSNDSMNKMYNSQAEPILIINSNINSNNSHDDISNNNPLRQSQEAYQTMSPIKSLKNQINPHYFNTDLKKQQKPIKERLQLDQLVRMNLKANKDPKMRQIILTHNNPGSISPDTTINNCINQSKTIDYNRDYCISQMINQSQDMEQVLHHNSFGSSIKSTTGQSKVNEIPLNSSLTQKNNTNPSMQLYKGTDKEVDKNCLQNEHLRPLKSLDIQKKKVTPKNRYDNEDIDNYDDMTNQADTINIYDVSPPVLGQCVTNETQMYDDDYQRQSKQQNRSKMLDKRQENTDNDNKDFPAESYVTPRCGKDTLPLQKKDPINNNPSADLRNKTQEVEYNNMIEQNNIMNKTIENKSYRNNNREIKEIKVKIGGGASPVSKTYQQQNDDNNNNDHHRLIEGQEYKKDMPFKSNQNLLLRSPIIEKDQSQMEDNDTITIQYHKDHERSNDKSEEINIKSEFQPHKKDNLATLNDNNDFIPNNEQIDYSQNTKETIIKPKRLSKNKKYERIIPMKEEKDTTHIESEMIEKEQLPQEMKKEIIDDIKEQEYKINEKIQRPETIGITQEKEELNNNDETEEIYENTEKPKTKDLKQSNPLKQPKAIKNEDLPLQKSSHNIYQTQEVGFDDNNNNELPTNDSNKSMEKTEDLPRNYREDLSKRKSDELPLQEKYKQTRKNDPESYQDPLKVKDRPLKSQDIYNDEEAKSKSKDNDKNKNKEVIINMPLSNKTKENINDLQQSPTSLNTNVNPKAIEKDSNPKQSENNESIKKNKLHTNMSNQNTDNLDHKKQSDKNNFINKPIINQVQLTEENPIEEQDVDELNEDNSNKNNKGKIQSKDIPNQENEVEPSLKDQGLKRPYQKVKPQSIHEDSIIPLHQIRNKTKDKDDKVANNDLISDKPNQSNDLQLVIIPITNHQEYKTFTFGKTNDNHDDNTKSNEYDDDNKYISNEEKEDKYINSNKETSNQIKENSECTNKKLNEDPNNNQREGIKNEKDETQEHKDKTNKNKTSEKPNVNPFIVMPDYKMGDNIQDILSDIKSEDKVNDPIVTESKLPHQSWSYMKISKRNSKELTKQCDTFPIEESTFYHPIKETPIQSKINQIEDSDYTDKSPNDNKTNKITILTKSSETLINNQISISSMNKHKEITNINVDSNNIEDTDNKEIIEPIQVQRNQINDSNQPSSKIKEKQISLTKDNKNPLKKMDNSNIDHIDSEKAKDDQVDKQSNYNKNSRILSTKTHTGSETQQPSTHHEENLPIRFDNRNIAFLQNPKTVLHSNNSQRNQDNIHQNRIDMIDKKIKTEKDNEINQQEIDKQEIDKQEIDKQEIDKQEIDKQEIDKQEIDKQEIDQQEIHKQEIDNEDNTSNLIDSNQLMPCSIQFEEETCFAATGKDTNLEEDNEITSPAKYTVKHPQKPKTAIEINKQTVKEDNKTIPKDNTDNIQPSHCNKENNTSYSLKSPKTTSIHENNDSGNEADYICVDNNKYCDNVKQSINETNTKKAPVNEDTCNRDNNRIENQSLSKDSEENPYKIKKSSTFNGNENGDFEPSNECSRPLTQRSIENHSNRKNYTDDWVISKSWNITNLIQPTVQGKNQPLKSENRLDLILDKMSYNNDSLKCNYSSSVDQDNPLISENCSCSSQNNKDNNIINHSCNKYIQKSCFNTIDPLSEAQDKTISKIQTNTKEDLSKKKQNEDYIFDQQPLFKQHIFDQDDIEDIIIPSQSNYGRNTEHMKFPTKLTKIKGQGIQGYDQGINPAPIDQNVNTDKRNTYFSNMHPLKKKNKNYFDSGIIGNVMPRNTAVPMVTLPKKNLEKIDEDDQLQSSLQENQKQMNNISNCGESFDNCVKGCGGGKENSGCMIF